MFDLRLSQISNRTSNIPSFRQGLAGNFAVIEMYLSGGKDLICLVPFASDQYYIAWFGFDNRAHDRFAAIDNQFIGFAYPIQTDSDVIQDQERIFGARIIRSGDHQIAQTGSFFAHQRALGSVAIASTSHDGDDATEPRGFAFQRSADRLQNVDQSIRGVRVIDDGRDLILRQADSLEPSGDAAASIDPARNRLTVEPERQSDSNRAEDIICVRAADQR
jgi:hypothetical protein